MTERDRRRRIVEYLQAGRTEEAASELAGCHESYPGDGVLHHAIGLAFASRGTLEAARQQLEAAARLSPHSAEIVADLAQVRLAQGQAQEAIEAAEQALSLYPDLPIARFTLGRACFALECARQARHPAPAERGQHFPLLDGRAPLYLRALREMEAVFDAAPAFARAVHGALAFAYLRAGHYHAAADQLRAELAQLPPGEEADRVRARLLYVEYEIVREQYWAVEELDLSKIQRAAEAPDASPEAKLRLAHAYAVLEDGERLIAALRRARAAGYEPRTARISRRGEERTYQTVSDAHLLIAGGLECILEDELRFLPFCGIAAIAFAPPAPWREAEAELATGERVEVVVPVLYRFSARSPSDLIQSGRFTQFRFAPGESRYAHAIGTRNLVTDAGAIPFTEIDSIAFC